MATDMLRVRSVGTGWAGGPGLTTFYFSPGAATIDAAMATNVTGRVRAYFDALKAFTAQTISWQVDATVDALDSATGQVTGQVTAGAAPSVVVGTLTGSIGPAFVCCIGRLRTSSFSNGRRIQGRTFYGPLSKDFTDSPAPEGALLAALQNGLTAVFTSAGGPLLAVWHRPKTTPVSAPGSIIAVSSTGTALEYGSLRSRR